MKHQENLAFYLSLDARDVRLTLDKYSREEAED
jgi:hypothetical protein